MIKKEPFHKIVALLKRFTDRSDLPDKLEDVRIVCTENCYVVIERKKTFYMLDKNQCNYCVSLMGCIDGKWNVHVYGAIRALRILGHVTKAEQDAYIRHLITTENAMCNAMDITKLHEKARSLGFVVVPQDEITEAVKP